ncbi:13399_t:CDS:1 [Ambispora gerdemannii]|uniref:13399_t:CDS:1 n=1 Tax=Ambispora gerdemannii TaxID=144530 RepID=A0A9N9DDB7_9GLOM|nr:13399_t:CDS:1 [Ambispora gerdemannii]
MNSNTNQEIFSFTDDIYNLLRYSYSVDEDTARLDEFHQTEQQHDESANIWSNFIEGPDLLISNENFLLDLDCSFNSEIPIVEVDFIPFSDLQSNPSIIDNEELQVEDISENQQDEDSSNTPPEKNIF